MYLKNDTTQTSFPGEAKNYLESYKRIIHLGNNMLM